MFGGLVSTDDKDLYDILVSIRAHGWGRDLDIDKQIELQEKTLHITQLREMNIIRKDMTAQNLEIIKQIIIYFF